MHLDDIIKFRSILAISISAAACIDYLDWLPFFYYLYYYSKAIIQQLFKEIEMTYTLQIVQLIYKLAGISSIRFVFQLLIQNRKNTNNMTESLNQLNQNHTIGKMYRLIPKLFRHSLNTRIRFSNTTDKDKIISQQPPKFQSHLFGIPLKAHVFSNASLILPNEQYKFYQRNSPNFIVVLVRKAFDLDSIENSTQVHNHGKEFYQECSYCKIFYQAGNKIQLTKLFKVKVEEIKKVDVIKQNIDNENEKKGTQGRQEKEHLKSHRKKNHSKLHLKRDENEEFNSYQLVVKKIEQHPPTLNPNLQFKFICLKTLLEESGMIMEGSNIKYNSFILDELAQRLVQPRKIEKMQAYLQSNEPEQKIDILIEASKKKILSEQHLSVLRNFTKDIIRNKKFYEYYTQLFKAAKNKVHGKKSKQLFIQKVTDSFNSMNPPQNIRQIFEKELQKFNQMDENSMESGVIKAYVEDLSKIPYNLKSEEIFDLQFAQKVMNQQHYGMKEVKDAILQIIAVGKLKKSLKGKIFCFIGGPGLGKTSFAKSVARALHRKFYSISLGGVTDSSVLKGHRRTYMGAYSGKIIQALKSCGTSNPVILLDEIDKMGSSSQGDPRSQLLQILDPNQNSSFVDNYVDVPVDLSNVLFITSANYEKSISKPLLDRMQKIYLTSYTKSEKIQIFNRHLLRRAIEQTGVEPSNFSLPPQVIQFMVQQYSLGEPGVRYLQKSALKLLEKVAYKMKMNEQVPIKITKQNLFDYLGKSYFRRKDHMKIGKGVAISLGGGNYGSRLTYIEAFRKSYINRKDINRGTLFTGSLGDIFKEAMNISYTYARNFLLEKFNNRYLYENEVHVHAPEGGFKKDGSTDSLTIVTSLISLALSERVSPGVAMTGEITLHGHILRTHSIKEKVLLAKRQRINQLILPRQNKPDVENLDKDLKQGINFHFIGNFEEAFPLLFPQIKVQNQKKQVLV